MSKPSGPFGMMCCSCFRFAGHDGKPVVIFETADGLVQGGVMLHGLTLKTAVDADSEAVKWFQSKSEADDFGIEHGWMVSDDEGPNHRCPECAAQYRRYQNRGAFIPMSAIFPDSANAGRPKLPATAERSVNA